MPYVFHAADAAKFNKHGVDLTVYGEGVPLANVVHVGVEEGHFQEFIDVESTFIYYIVDGRGTFVLNDDAVEVKPTDLVVIPSGTRIHYFGKLDMVLTVSIAFKEENERHIRFVAREESPYLQ